MITYSAAMDDFKDQEPLILDSEFDNVNSEMLYSDTLEVLKI